MQKSKILKVILCSAAALLAAMPFVSLAQFDPSNLVRDNQFVDVQTFGGAEGIQTFLRNKNSVLANTNNDFLLKLKEPSDSKVKAGLGDPRPELGRLRTAAELIWDASQKAGINPQVILVTLQKEQSLITAPPRGESETQRMLDFAMGFNCRDNSPCEKLFAGFYYQLFGNFDAQGNRYIGAPASLMRSYNTPNGRGPAVDAQNQTFGSPTARTSRVWDTIVVNNTQGPPNNAPATQTITLSNLATAALYRYTPHVYNGNYNFWKFFSTWFKYANGTLLKLSSDNNIYIINNGAKSLLLNFVMQSRGLNPQTANIITVSQNELLDYDNSGPYPPPDNLIVNINTDQSKRNYVFQNGKKHPVSYFVLQQRGLDPTTALTITQEESDMFGTGPLLTPKDGTLIRGNNSRIVFLIKDSRKAALSAFTFKQYGFADRDVVVLPQEEVDLYDYSGFVLPKNDTLLKYSSDPQVYLLQNQLLLPISEVVFKLKKFNNKDVVVLDKSELAAASLGNFVSPPENTYFRVPETKIAYVYTNGTRHSISDFVLKQRKISNLVSIGLAESLAMPEGLPLPPKDGTLIKGDASAAIFAIAKGQKTALDYNTWVKKYKKQKPIVLPQMEVDSYPNETASGSIEQ